MRVSYYKEDPHGAGIKIALYPESVKDSSDRGEPLFRGYLDEIPKQYDECEVVAFYEVVASSRENPEDFVLYIKGVNNNE